MDSRSFNILSLCSGIGSLDLVVKLAVPNARTICYVEIEAFAQHILVARMQQGFLDDASLWSDLGTFDGKPWRGKVDCIIAGFPCTPWSIAGKKRGTADDRWLWPDIIRIIRQVEPEYVFIENVPGLCDGGLEHVLGDLAEKRFNAEWLLLSAFAIGATHRRKRLFLLAHCHREWQQQSDWSERNERGRIGNSGKPVGDAANNEQWQQRQSETETAKRETARRFETGGSSSAVVNATGIGFFGGDAPERSCDRTWLETEAAGSIAASDESGDGIGLFPPGPDDTDSWRYILDRWPWLAPALKSGVCVDLDGLAVVVGESRVDQLRALGNAVVSLQASVAFAILADRLGVAERIGVVK